MNEQETFDKVAAHLLKQNKKAEGPAIHVRAEDIEYTEAVCKYRSKGGLKCAVGCLILDEYYDERMEGNSVSQLMHEFPNAMTAAGITDSNSDLLRDMQEIHDCNEPEEWEYELKYCAARFRLNDAIISNVLEAS